MRLRHPDGSTVHLAYCTNVHPAEEINGILELLRQFAAPVRATLGVPRLGVGLWLASDVAAELAADIGGRLRLRAELDRLGLEVVTLNGFPYRAFHAPVVKLAVYEPDWADPARADYTLDLARVLVDLMPDDAVEGSISTLPLAWRNGWDPRREQACYVQLARVNDRLTDLEARTGRSIRVGLEPEPGCAVETTQQAIDALTRMPTDHLGLCLDTCHLAVQFEDPAAAIATAELAGIPVVKSQLACALRVPEPDAPGVRAALNAFAEPRFLHQTRMRSGKGAAGVDDLPEALDGGLPTNGEWRVHFHTAIHTEGEPPLFSSQEVLVDALRALVGGTSPITRHLEVETYTWTVLPPERRPADDAALVANVAHELEWARRQLANLGLEEIP